MPFREKATINRQLRTNTGWSSATASAARRYGSAIGQPRLKNTARSRSRRAQSAANPTAAASARSSSSSGRCRLTTTQKQSSVQSGLGRALKVKAAPRSRVSLWLSGFQLGFAQPVAVAEADCPLCHADAAQILAQHARYGVPCGRRKVLSDARIVIGRGRVHRFFRSAVVAAIRRVVADQTQPPDDDPRYWFLEQPDALAFGFQ